MPIQSLESRRLLADLTMEINDLVSHANGHATLNGEQLAASSNLDMTSTFRGDLAVSDTRRGIKVQSADIEFVRETGGASFVFQTGDAGGEVVVLGPSIVIRSSRIAAPNGKFSTTRLSVEYDDGDLVMGGNVVADLTGQTATMEYAIGRVKRGEDALVLTIPFHYTIRSTFTLAGQPQTLDYMMDGKIVATAELAGGQSLVAAPTQKATKAKTRLVADVVD